MDALSRPITAGRPALPGRAGSAAEAAGLAARDSYGRLLALLAASTSDIAAAEDALADAFERALRTWPERGTPANPDAWLLTVARNRLRDQWKSARRSGRCRSTTVRTRSLIPTTSTSTRFPTGGLS